MKHRHLAGNGRESGVPESPGDPGEDHARWKRSLTGPTSCMDFVLPSHAWEPAYKISAICARAHEGREATEWAKLVSAALPHTLPGASPSPSR